MNRNLLRRIFFLLNKIKNIVNSMCLCFLFVFRGVEISFFFFLHSQIFIENTNFGTLIDANYFQKKNPLELESIKN